MSWCVNNAEKHIFPMETKIENSAGVNVILLIDFTIKHVGFGESMYPPNPIIIPLSLTSIPLYGP